MECFMRRKREFFRNAKWGPLSFRNRQTEEVYMGIGSFLDSEVKLRIANFSGNKLDCP